MAYQLSTLVAEILDLSKDSSFSTARIKNYIQRTQDSVLGHQRFKFNEKHSLATLATDQATHTPTVAYQSILTLVLSHADLGTPAQPTYLPPGEFFDCYPAPEGLPSGRPHFYTDYGAVIYWSCPLDKDYSLALRYVAAPKRLTADTDVPDIPEEFKDIIIKGGLAGIEEYRENFDIAALYKREIENLTEDMLGRYSLRKLQPGRVKTSRYRRREI